MTGRTPRPTWDEYGLILAQAVATRADCTRAQVGAVLMNSRHEVRGTGYNGAPSGIPGCATAGACPRGRHYAARTWCFVHDSEECACAVDFCACGGSWPCEEAATPGAAYADCIADHAERNALRHTDPSELPGATLHTTREPCASCWTLIRAAGIARVVIAGDSSATYREVHL